MDVKSKLSEFVGAENFSDDPVQLQNYATDFSYTPGRGTQLRCETGEFRGSGPGRPVLSGKKPAGGALQFQGPFLSAPPFPGREEWSSTCPG